MAESALGFLLVHGGCHGGWCWERVIPHLDHPARAVDLPGRGTRPVPPDQVTLQSLVDTVCEEALATGWDRIILVGHSIAGTVLPAAAARLGQQVAHAVFVSCVIPPAGGRGIDAFPDRLKFIARTAWLEPSPLARWTRRRGFKPPPGVGRLLLANDLGAADQRLVMRRLNREPTAVLTTPVHEQLPQNVPRTYVVLTRDRTLPPGTQLRMASRLEPVRLVPVEAGHLAMLSQPERLAEVLNGVASDPVDTTMADRTTGIRSTARMARSIPELLLERAERTPEELFLRCGDAQLTFEETADRAERIAGALHAAGVEPGDRVAVLSPNRPEVLELLFGCARLGAIQVPINAFLKGQFLRYQLEDSQAQALVVDAVGYRAVAPLLDQLPGLRRLVLLDPVNAPPGSDVMPYGDLLDGKPTCQAPVPNADAVMTIGYTSGTTGAPKGCILSHGYYLRVAARMEDAWELTADDRLITALPLFHGGARMMVVATALRTGIAVAVEREFSPSSFLHTAATSKATVAFGVGAMGMALLGTPPSPADRAHGLRLVMWVPFSLEHQRQFEERFGASVLAEGYGQTECVPVSYSRVSGVRRRATAGVPAPDLDVRLVDDDDVDVAPGIPGEIVLRPRTPHAMFSGYWRKPDATLIAYRNLWYHTGDYGTCDEDGFISFVDRKKDALRRRGENVSSLELEAAIAAHSKIAEASVHAIPSELTEDDIKACLVLVPGASVEPAELFDFLKGNLPYFAIPRYVEILPELPKNATARVMKHLLRERGITQTTWDFDALGLTISRSDRR